MLFALLPNLGTMPCWVFLSSDQAKLSNQALLFPKGLALSHFFHIFPLGITKEPGLLLMEICQKVFFK